MSATGHTRRPTSAFALGLHRDDRLRAVRADYGQREGDGAQGRDRTTDTAIFSRMLYQLSYLGRSREGQKSPASRRVIVGQDGAVYRPERKFSHSFCRCAAAP